MGCPFWCDKDDKRNGAGADVYQSVSRIKNNNKNNNNNNNNNGNFHSHK